MKETIANILKEYTKKNHISASFVILEDYAEEIANAIIADGWMKIPCRVGNTIYVLSNGMVHQTEVIKIKYEEEAENHGKFVRARIYAVMFNVLQEFNFSDIGKTVFLTREEAEQKLKGGEG